VADAAYGKIRKQLADHLKVTLHDADIILLMDDWLDSLKDWGHAAINKAKDWYHNNRDQVR